MWDCIGTKLGHAADCMAGVPIMLAVTGLVPDVSALIGAAWYATQIWQSELGKSIREKVASWFKR
jgi:hypothetical protein